MQSILKISLILITGFLSMQNASAVEQTNDIDAINSKMAMWVEAWDIGTEAFNPAVFENLFMPGKDAISVFDNVQGDVLTLSSVDAYMETWGPFMEPLPVWHVVLKDFTVKVSGNLAFTTFRLVGTDTQGPNGENFPFGQYGTHVWQKADNNQWYVVHEHLTAYDVTNPAHEK